MVWQIISPFISALALSVIIVTICQPMYDKIKQIRDKQREADRIDRQIEALIKAAIAESNKALKAKEAGASSNTFALTEEAKALAADFTSNKGKLPWPVSNGVVISTKRILDRMAFTGPAL